MKPTICKEDNRKKIFFKIITKFLPKSVARLGGKCERETVQSR